MKHVTDLLKMAAATLLYASLACAAIWLASLTGCSKAYEPDRIAPDAELHFYTKTVTPISADTAMFTLTDAYGSEITVKVWRDGDSLACDYTTGAWWKWIKCVFKGMEACDHHNTPEEYWQCVGIWASGCALGIGYIEFCRTFLTFNLG